MYIKSLEINNIKSISNFKMDFENPAGWHVIIGDNGSGKSSVVKAISLALLDHSDIIMATKTNYDEWLKYGTKLGFTRIKIGFNGNEVYNQYVIEEINKKILLKSVLFRGVDTFEAKLSSSEQITTTTTTTQQQPPPTPTPTTAAISKTTPCIPIESVSISQVYFFSCAFGPFRRFSGGDIDREKLFKTNQQLGSHLSIFGEDVALSEALTFLNNQFITENLLGNGEKVEHFLDSLKKFINDSDLLPHSTKISDITKDVVYILDGNGLKIDTLQMSDGYRSMISMIFELIRQLIRVFGKDLVFRNESSENFVIDLEGVVIIDEIDAHLYPSWQTKIGQWFTKYFPNIQFIVTTHSPLICRASENGTIWRLNAPGTENESDLEITGIMKNRLVRGNILDAYGTEIFGENVSIPDESNSKLDRLAELNIKSIMGLISENEQVELENLKSFFPSDLINDSVKN